MIAKRTYLELTNIGTPNFCDLLDFDGQVVTPRFGAPWKQ